MNPSTRHRFLAASAIALAIGTGGAFAQSASTDAAVAQAAPQTPPRAAPQGPGAGAPEATPHRHGHAHGMRHGPTAQGHGAHHGERMLRRLDTDRDGRISRAEFDAAQQQAMARRMKAFDTADTDRDGQLTQAEMLAFRDTMRARHHGARGHRHGDPGGTRGGQEAPGLAPSPGEGAPRG